MANVLSTNPVKEASSSLQFLAEQTDDVFDDIYRWKWIIIGLHNSLQIFMVLALRGGNGFGALREEDRRKHIEAYRNGEHYSGERLAPFLELYSRIKNKEYVKIYSNSKVFKPEGDQGWSIKKLNEFRNKFIHFRPHSWLVEVSGMPKIAIDCMAIIHFCAWESKNLTGHSLGKIDKKAFEKAKENFEELNEIYLKEIESEA